MNDQQWLAFRTRAHARFDRAWRRCEDRGQCDGYGGVQYGRVLAEWLEAGCPPRIAIFIQSACNDDAEA